MMMMRPEPERASGSLRCRKMLGEAHTFDAHLSGFQRAVRRRRGRQGPRGRAHARRPRGRPRQTRAARAPPHARTRGQPAGAGGGARARWAA